MANSKRQRKNTASLLGALFRTFGKRGLLVMNERSLGGKSSETKSLPAFFSPSPAPSPRSFPRAGDVWERGRKIHSRHMLAREKEPTCSRTLPMTKEKWLEGECGYMQAVEKEPYSSSKFLTKKNATKKLAGIYRIQRVISLLMFFTESQFRVKVTELTLGHSSGLMNILYIKINKLRIKSKTSFFMWRSSNIFHER